MQTSARPSDPRSGRSFVDALLALLVLSVLLLAFAALVGSGSALIAQSRAAQVGLLNERAEAAR